ncbi:MAG: elongation factor P [Candidatus Pacebacteria bacterium]|nr:elongation factor P [Candidatus Paceibacterota bacterium]
MKISANELRGGNVMEFRGKLWAVVKAQHITPGKGGAFMQVELRDLSGSTKLNERFRSAESVERVRIDEQEFQYLFGDDTTLTFMDEETFEQLAVPRDLLGDEASFLQDGMKVTISLYEGTAISVTLPQSVVLTLTEADPVVKGQTASSSYKPGKLENGLRILVPPHLEAGVKIVVNTADGSYMERYKG